jgi:hypothetical protein
MSGHAAGASPASSAPGAARAGLLACFSALTYVGVCRATRQLRGIAGKPWPLLGLLAAIALFAGLQLLALDRVGEQGALDPSLLDPVLRFAPLLLAAALFFSTFSTPLRLQVADVSWVLTAPGGGRALFARALLLRPLGYAAIGYLGASIARWSLGRPVNEVWKIALVAAAAGLALRLVSFGGHILVVRARAAVALRAVAVTWGIGLVLAAVVDLPGGGWLGLRPVVRPLLAGVLQPSQLSGQRLLVVMAVLLVASVALVAAARGFEERARLAARHIAEAQEALRRFRSGQQLSLTQFRTGSGSLPGWSALAGERALFFRALAQQRRLTPPSWVALGLLVDLGGALVLLSVAPAFTWGWAAVCLAAAVWSGGSMLAIELDHYHVRIAPLRPLPALLCLAAVTAVQRIVSIELAWLVVLFAPGVTAGAWVTGVLLIPCLVALVEGAGALAVAVADRPLSRGALKVAIGTIGALPAIAALTAGAALGWPATVVAPLAAAALLALAWCCLARAANHIWPRARASGDRGLPDSVRRLNLARRR